MVTVMEFDLNVRRHQNETIDYIAYWINMIFNLDAYILILM